METPSTLPEINTYIKNQGKIPMDEKAPIAGSENRETAPETTEPNQQLIKTLRDASYTVLPGDKVIRHGDTIILRKLLPGATNPDGSQKYHDQPIELIHEKK